MKIKEILQEENIEKEQKKLALEQVLNLSKPEIILNKERKLTKKEYKSYQRVIKKLQKDIPIQYITNKAYFYGEEFFVNKNVLIPRPETETLVKDTLTLIDKHFKDKNLKVLDIGTGSGIIAITLNKENKNLKITATDISKKALKVSKKNQKTHQTDIKFINTDLYKNIKDEFDIIISNPPYINENSKQVQKQVIKNEPHLALFGGKDGLDFYRNILKDIKTITKNKHIIAFEIGENQGKKIEKLIKKQFPKDKVIIKKDYNGFDRYIYSVSI